METKATQDPVSPPKKRLSIFWALLLIFTLVVGIWYAQSNQAQDIVSGVISNPEDVLLSHEGHT